MWIRMKETYVGTLGTFPKDHKLDLPPETVKGLPNDSYEETCAPWDEHRDPKAIGRAELHGRLQDTRKRAEQLQAEAEKLRQKADRLVEPSQVTHEEASKAMGAAEKAQAKAKKKNASEEVKAEAAAFARIANRAALKEIKVDAEIRLVVAEADLKQLDVEDTMRNAGKLAKEIAAEKARLAEQNSEPNKSETNDEQSKETETTEPAVGGD